MGTVCFDLGGVLFDIHHTWAAAAEAEGLTLPPGNDSLRLVDVPALHAFQEESIDYETYLAEISRQFALTTDQADRLHRGIVKGEFPGAADLVDHLHAGGWITACLSNTNAPHWESFFDPKKFPGFNRIKIKLASHEIEVNKPDLRAYAALERLAPAPIYFFDDASANVDAATEFGWIAYLVPHSQNPIPGVREIIDLV